MSNPVLQWQIVASDPAAVTRFYGDLFGWKATTANALGYRQIETGAGISGGVWPAPADAQSFVQLFIGVQDVEQTVAQAVRLGAKTIVPPSLLPDGDHIAILQDPTGITFGVMRR
jgi:predicted enzyme related to lactoylglutathione lyase